MEKIMYRWWKKLVSLLNTNVSASFSTRPLFQLSRQLPTAAKGNRVQIMSHWEAEIYIKFPASVLLILCTIRSFKMVSTIRTKTAVHRRDEPEILSTKKRQYPSLSAINGARMRTSDHESPIPPMQLELQPVSRHWGHMTWSCHLNMPASVSCVQFTVEVIGSMWNWVRTVWNHYWWS